MKYSFFNVTKSLLLILFLSFNTTLYSVNDNAGLKLFRPANGLQITDNMPILSWEKIECQQYQVWIDGIKMDSVNASQNWYIPFPMSYGKHQWKVIAQKGQLKISSEPFSFSIEDKPLSPVPANAVLLRNDWRVISSLIVGSDGSVLSRDNINTTAWQSSSIPATVLSVMVRNGLYPNPYIGTNNIKIPDISDDFNTQYNLLQYSHIKNKNPWKDPYWFRKEFTIPEGYSGKTIWLNLAEINYKAEVWLNGKKLADTTTVIGMERQFRFDITTAANLKKNNILAIAIYPPNHPGKPANEPLTPLADPGTNMADGVISKDYTKWDVMGWDWQPSIRDRDMGITDDVFINATESIELGNLYVSSKLPLPDTTSADLTISSDLINHSALAKSGKIKGSVSFGKDIITLEQSFTVAPYDTLKLLWNNENMPQLHLKNPKLWWPNGYGKPELYDLNLEAATNNDEHSNLNIRFGIRQIETYIGAKERVYKINGQDIYCKGGNWVIDMMLNWTAKRYEEEILLTRKSNLNMLRIWGPTGVPPEAFYAAADENGILIWQDFLNDFWGTFRNKEGFRPELSIFEKATTVIVMKYRNHPSLIMWCGGNEGVNPREDLIVNKILPKYDGRDSKFYLKSSNGDGMHGGGPYHTLEPNNYFTSQKLNGFSSEIGPSGVPVFESVQKFMPLLGKTWMPGRYPIDGVWAYHDANDWPGKDTRKFSSYDNIVRNYYGVSDSTSLAGAENYLNKCQLVNYDVYRASIEAISSQLWKNSSGILLWKSNSSWPSMTWQVYDWYLQAHAGYYAARKAAAPLGIQFNRKSMKVEVVNANLNELKQVVITATLYNSGLNKIWNSSETLNLQKNSVAELKEAVPVTEKICYLKLTVQNLKGEALADNIYWLSTSNNFKDFNALTEPEMTIQAKKTKSKDKFIYRITLSNAGKIIALMTELKLIDSNTGLEILPAFWTDNYLSLLPGEKKEVTLEVNANNLPGDISLKYRAFNMKEAKIIKP